MTDELRTITVTLKIEPTALTLLQQQMDQQDVTLDQRVTSDVRPPSQRRMPGLSGPPTPSMAWWSGTSQSLDGQRQSQDVRVCALEREGGKQY